jgi:predicted AAA+ superfamily ATPase
MAIIKRELGQKLLDELGDTSEHPNVIFLEGARQVGKTTLVEGIAAKLDREMVKINLEENRSAKASIDSCNDFSDFEKFLAIEYGFKGDGSKVLFIDEAQESVNLGGFIRFMKEKWAYTRVILTGSSMARIFKQNIRFPVGRITRFHLQPLNYSEFLEFSGASSLLDIEKPFDVSDYVHAENLRQLQSYIDVGGLPAVVNDYVAGKSWRKTRSDLYLDYKADFSRIFSDAESNMFDVCLRGVSNNLGSPSLYSQVIKTTSSLYKKIPDFMNLLEAWKLVHKTETRSIKADSQNFSPKRYLYDIGISNDLRLFAYPKIDIIETCNASLRKPLGGIIENILALELVSQGFELASWKKNQNSYEVDFVIKNREGISIPVECKASLQSKASHTIDLKEYSHIYESPKGILVNLAKPARWRADTGVEIVSIPAYLLKTLSSLVS